MLLLLVMTILALSMSQTTRMQERMAGSSRDTSIAFQAADSALRGAQDYLVGLSDRPIPCDDPKDCTVMSVGHFDTIDLSRQSEQWWIDNGKEYGSSSKDIANVADDPKYVIEYYGDTKGKKLTIGRGAEERKVFYKATAHAYGGSKVSEVVTESVYALPE
jgi:type IV pilus assembly protein PilX